MFVNRNILYITTRANGNEDGIMFSTLTLLSLSRRVPDWTYQEELHFNSIQTVQTASLAYSSVYLTPKRKDMESIPDSSKFELFLSRSVLEAM